ncbi:hypothetical protein THIOM_000228 [Candidatus Thiomargarita nelsonii]|uniref:Uncharacterized protein n=1 Tax=Candidatus Thiomargarita nelsonii TaxID=1003181 RepID=A0A176S7Q6_9GAMM|nr:hypothetical protein THIOM_000228 [Candidatus Thiomargarita nelsonii]
MQYKHLNEIVPKYETIGKLYQARENVEWLDLNSYAKFHSAFVPINALPWL